MLGKSAIDIGINLGDLSGRIYRNGSGDAVPYGGECGHLCFVVGSTMAALLQDSRIGSSQSEMGWFGR